MSTVRANWSLEMLIRANVGDETDKEKVRIAAEDAIAEYRARTRAREVNEQAHRSYQEFLRG